MKTINKLKFLAVGFLMVAFTACVQDDEFDTPNTTPAANTIDVASITDIDAVIDALVQSGEQALTFEVDAAPIYVDGYVISSDEGGNYFKELTIQDSPSNPQAGIVIQIDEASLFTTYDFGRRIIVQLNGLAVTIDNGLYQLGIPSGNEINRIPEPQVDSFITRTDEVATIVPTVVTIGDFATALNSTYIQLDNMQFNRNDVAPGDAKTFAGEASDQFDGERVLESCDTGATTILSTSTFADFASLTLPAGKGSVTGVLSRDFFDDFFIVVVNDPSKVDLTSTDRCDPDFLECNGTNLGGSVIVLDQDFESITDESQLDGLGWTNVNVSGGTERYEDGSFSGNRYIQINAFNQNDDPMIAWLVTPAMDFDASSNEAFSMDVQANFDQGGKLEVFISNAYTGDPLTTMWQQLDVNIPTGPSGGFASSFENVGTVDVSCIDGTDVRIALRYEASDPMGTTTRYHIDNLEVNGDM